MAVAVAPAGRDEGARRRVLEALELIGAEFGTKHPRLAGQGWEAEALAELAEAIAGLLLESRAGGRRGRVARRP
jgi:hypothetical protein